MVMKIVRVSSVTGDACRLGEQMGGSETKNWQGAEKEARSPTAVCRAAVCRAWLHHSNIRRGKRDRAGQGGAAEPDFTVAAARAREELLRSLRDPICPLPAAPRLCPGPGVGGWGEPSAAKVQMHGLLPLYPKGSLRPNAAKELCVCVEKKHHRPEVSRGLGQAKSL